MPSSHLHPLWQTWDVAVDDFCNQLPIKLPVAGEPFACRSPILVTELLQSFEAILILYQSVSLSSQHEDQMDRQKVAKIASETLPVILYAALSSKYRLTALNLLCVCLVFIDGFQFQHR